MAKRRFSAQSSTINRALELVMKKMEAKEYKILQENTGMVTIMFARKGIGMVKEYHFICDTYSNMTDNYRACQLAISRLWSIYEECGVRTNESESTFDNLAAGFRVLYSQQILLSLPDPETRTPYQVLGVTTDATSEEINKAYKKYAKLHHPDKHGGDEEMMKVGNKAKEELLGRL